MRCLAGGQSLFGVSYAKSSKCSKVSIAMELKTFVFMRLLLKRIHKRLAKRSRIHPWLFAMINLNTTATSQLRSVTALKKKRMLK
jgi:hypothetical protein